MPAGSSTTPIGDVPDAWLDVLGPAALANLAGLEAFVGRERESHNIYPSPSDVFAALRLTPFTSVRSVILGQDPYVRPGQAPGDWGSEIVAAARIGDPTAAAMGNAAIETMRAACVARAEANKGTQPPRAPSNLATLPQRWADPMVAPLELAERSLWRTR